MKRSLCLVLCAAMLLSLTAACQAPAAEPDPPSRRPEPPAATATAEAELSCASILSGIWTRLGIALSNAEAYGLPHSNDGADGQEQTAAYLEGAYGLEEGEWEDAAIARETGASAVEMAVLRFPDEDAARRGYDCLEDYLHGREGDFTGYAPEQARLVADAALVIEGRHVGLFIVENSGYAGQVFSEIVESGVIPEPTPESESSEPVDDVDEPPDQVPVYYESPGEDASGLEPAASPDPDSGYPGRTPFTDPGKEDMSIYDTGSIRAAWENNDPAGLSEKDRAVYDAAQEILGEVLSGSMTGLEKETAIYRWLVDNVNYDYTHQDILVQTPRVSYEPYGGLVEHNAVCLGYATSFQLLCDLAGVECITVVGAAFHSEEHHAWNMVRLDGQWYCVDVTWDANGREQLGPSYQWRYFNITSDELAQNHQWDYANTPEATAKS